MNTKSLFTEKKNLQNMANNNGGVVQLNKSSKFYKHVLSYIELMKLNNDLTVVIENGKIIVFTCKRDFRMTIKATVDNVVTEARTMLQSCLKRLILLGDKNRIEKIQIVLSKLEKI